jgi:hypothetical protein
MLVLYGQDEWRNAVRKKLKKIKTRDYKLSCEKIINIHRG